MAGWVQQRISQDLLLRPIDYALAAIFLINGIIHLFGGAGYRLDKSE